LLVALLVVHAGNGFFLASNGIEYALALLAATVSLTFSGGGSYALDNTLVATNVHMEV
jgi:putative oxidoreductase